MNTTSKKFNVTVPTLLVLLSLVILVPLIAFTLFSIERFTDRLSKVEYQAIESRTASVSASVDREIESLIGIGNALASSPSLASGNLAAFHAEARQARRGETMQVLLLATNMEQLVNTRVSFGTVLPVTGSPDSTQKAIVTRKPVVSDIFIGKVSRRAVFNVSQPIIISGDVRYVLTVTDEPSRLSTLLQQQKLPKGWRITLRDQKAETFASDAGAGQDALVHFDLPKDRLSGLIPDHAISGESVVTAYVTSELTGWTTSLWVPRKVLSQPMDDLWKIMVRAALLAVASTILVAYFFSRPFANLIRQTSETVSFMGRGAPLPPIHTILREGQDIERRLIKTDAELRHSQQQNREGKALLDKLLDTVPTGITVVDYPAFKVVAESRQARLWLGQTGADLMQDVPAAGAFSTVFMADGQTPMTWEQSPTRRAAAQDCIVSAERYVVQQPDGNRIQIEVSVSPFHDQQGKVIGTVGCWRDVTEEVSFLKKLQDNDEHLRLVLRELTHRAKNLLTIIMAIATQTARRNSTLDEFLHVFAKRVQGLGASHDLLVHADWRGVELRELLLAQLAPFGGVDGERIRISGPAVLLKPDVLQSLGLAFHELATNAMKYGALSDAKGKIEVTWNSSMEEGDASFNIDWIEKNGPLVKPPEIKGFGHVIMVTSLAATVNGKVDLSFNENGLRWCMTAPLSAVARDDAQA
jgi:PAS domain S-box-containing protein